MLFGYFVVFYWVTALNNFNDSFTSEKSHNCVLKFNLASFWDVCLWKWGDAEFFFFFFFACLVAVVVVGSPAQFCAGGL